MGCSAVSGRPRIQRGTAKEDLGQKWGITLDNVGKGKRFCLRAHRFSREKKQSRRERKKISGKNVNQKIKKRQEQGSKRECENALTEGRNNRD